MGQYLVSYDLHQSGRNYDRIRQGIVSLGDTAKLLESVWLVNHAYTAEQVRIYLEQYIDSNDSIAVIEIGVNWATQRCQNDGVAFLKRHRP